ncbi:MAG: four helix bundle protein [Gemmatimonadaceae bacterium]
MEYDEWERTVPPVLKGDLLWRVQAYRLAAFLGHCADEDTRRISGDARFVQNAAQLCRAAGSIAANTAEAYSRQSKRDRIRFYEYALGSAAEAKTWYLGIRSALDAPTLDARLAVLQSITRLLLTMIRSSRGAKPLAHSS